MDHRFPIIYDRFMSLLEKGRIENIRKDLIKYADGHVLEIGAGTGLNFPYYRQVSAVEAVDPDLAMINYAFKRGKKAVPAIKFHEGRAEDLPFKNKQFDSIVATLVFCTIADPKLAIKEIERVGKPGSKVLLFEHVKSEQRWKAAFQEKITPIWKRVCGGCHLNRDTVHLIQESSIVIDSLESFRDGLFIKIVGHIPT
ncbi:class I SAM-dependent methyltransferase [Halobacillus andaensis]|uniref:class I SAM-dependent methyltransferase n=1 Tax=Halobacillus andaensis TaxID=1176239 RepID=UPI003D761A4A